MTRSRALRRHVQLAITSWLAAAFVATPLARADPGTGKKVTGIVLLSAGSAVGGALMLGALLAKSCGSYDNECDRSQRTGDALFVAGLVLIPTSIVSGVLLIRSGRQEQRLSAGLGLMPSTLAQDSAAKIQPLLNFKLVL